MSSTAVDDDLLSAEATRDPYAYFGRLRDHDPVHWNERHSSWIVTRHRDVSAGLRDLRLSSDRLIPYFGARRPEGAAIGDWMAAVREILARWMVFKDPPEHTRLRRLVHPHFTPKAVRGLAPRVRAIADDLLSDMVAAGRRGGPVDYIRAFAFPFPAIVIAEVLGVPPADRDLFKSWSDELHPLVFGALRSPGRHERAARALLELSGYFRRLMADRRRPGGDLLSALLAEHGASGDQVSADEIVAMCVMLLFAGHETTTNLLANGLLALLRHPGELSLLRDRPSLVPAAVEESLRYDGPVKLSVRWVRDDLELGGRQVAAGGRVLLVQASANRDPAVFASPADFIVTRRANPHVAFGLGAHFCLGASLARLEAEAALRAVLERLPGVRLADADLEWEPTIMVRGLRALPVHAT